MKLTRNPAVFCLEISEDEAQRLYALVGATHHNEKGTEDMFKALDAALGEKKYQLIDEDGGEVDGVDFKEIE